jgi:tetratricopeptide (TPR) repeat protein
MFGLILIIMAVFFGCVAPASNMDTANTPAQSVGDVYHPKLPPGIEGLHAAKADLAVLLKTRIRPVRIEFGDGYHAQQGSDGLIWNEAWKELNRGVNADLVEIHLYDIQSRKLSALMLRNIAAQEDRFLIYPSISIPYTGFYDSPISVKTGEDAEYPYAVEVRDWISFRFHAKDFADAKRFADDLYYMQQWERREQEQQLALFESRAKQWRALKKKPRITKKQRKLIVQADALNRQKDYAGAIDLYLKAVELQPASYPGAYFNLALLFAQLQRYNSAISYMKRYLLLVPEAQDSRSAQDRIYEWELMMKE